jgi:cytochrome c peroxidase
MRLVRVMRDTISGEKIDVRAFTFGYFFIKVFLTISLATASCTSEVETYNERISVLHLQVLPEVEFPEDNPFNEDKRLLGKMLFWDPILSGQRDVACASCHLPDYGYADGLDLSIGVGGKGFGLGRVQTDKTIPLASRNAPTILNSCYNGLLNTEQSYDPYNAPMFWDGRKKSLEVQCLGPFTMFNTMRGRAYTAEVAYDSIVQRLNSIPEYVRLFNEVFGQGPITLENLTKAIVSFERSIESDNSPYDQYVNGNKEALTRTQQEGLLLFFGKANCSSCHSGPMFSDYNYYNLGIPFNSKIPADSGRNKTFAFRTPTLRNASLTAPFMHNGVYATLEDVLDHYNEGTTQNDAIHTIDKKIRPLYLNEDEKHAIISFIEGLTDNDFDRSQPQSVPSGLKPGGS